MNLCPLPALPQIPKCRNLGEGKRRAQSKVQEFGGGEDGGHNPKSGNLGEGKMAGTIPRAGIWDEALTPSPIFRS
jgi:hypothetical protein